MEFSDRLVAPEHVLIRELEGESVLVNLETEHYFGLDDVGTRIWTLLTTEESVQAAFDQLLEEYEVSPDALRTDITALIKDLMSEGLLEAQGK